MLEMPDIEVSTEDFAQRFSGNIGNWILSVQDQITLQMLAPYPGATILDLGGGYGRSTQTLIQNDFDVTIAGSSEMGLAPQIKPYIERGLCKYEVVDFLNLPFQDQAFGVVICYRVLPYVKHWREFIAEITRVAERCVIIDYPEKHAVRGLVAQVFVSSKYLHGGEHPYQSFSERQLVDQFRQHNFGSLERYPEFFLPLFFHRKLKARRISELSEKFFRITHLTSKFGSPVILKLVREREGQRRLNNRLVQQ